MSYSRLNSGGVNLASQHEKAGRKRLGKCTCRNYTQTHFGEVSVNNSVEATHL